ncbi:hypothetical protein QFZ65_003287 [Arthrobacter sp. B3I9]|nr:hypothetical protein [Arthrobacter sp. B3I9]
MKSRRAGTEAPSKGVPEELNSGFGGGHLIGDGKDVAARQLHETSPMEFADWSHKPPSGKLLLPAGSINGYRMA